MRVGEPKYKKCPGCGEMDSYYPGPYFFHIYGAIEWSDGKVFSSLPATEIKRLHICESCKNFYWHWRYYALDLDLSFNENVRALIFFQRIYGRITLKNLLFKPFYNDRLFYIRISIWHSFNNRFREFPENYRCPRKPQSNLNDQIESDLHRQIYDDNAKELIRLMRSNREDYLMLKAELYRNIGEFETALEVINRVKTEKYLDAKNKIIREINLENKNTIIIEQPIYEDPIKEQRSEMDHEGNCNSKIQSWTDLPGVIT